MGGSFAVGGGEDEYRVLGGSSSVLSSALKEAAEVESECTSSMMMTLAAALRRIGDLLAKIAHLIDAAVGRGIDFENIQIVFACQRLAGGALPARLAVLRVFTVDGAGENARGGGFAGSACAVEEISMGDAARFDPDFSASARWAADR